MDIIKRLEALLSDMSGYGASIIEDGISEITRLMASVEKLERENAKHLEPIDTGNLAGDSLYKSLDDLYSQGWKDRHKEQDWDPRGCKEWQVPIDLFRANVSILQQKNAKLKEQLPKWKPIDTAPKTTKAILVWCPENKCTYLVSWNGAHWAIFGGNGALLYHNPTLWMPVPVPIEKNGSIA